MTDIAKEWLKEKTKENVMEEQALDAALTQLVEDFISRNSETNSLASSQRSPTTGPPKLRRFSDTEVAERFPHWCVPRSREAPQSETSDDDDSCASDDSTCTRVLEFKGTPSQPAERATGDFKRGTDPDYNQT